MQYKNADHRPLRHYLGGWAGDPDKGFIDIEVSSQLSEDHLAYFFTQRAKPFEKKLAEWTSQDKRMGKKQNRIGCLIRIMEAGGDPFGEDWLGWLE